MSSEPKKCKASDAAMRAAESLFVNGFNEEAERLILWQDSTQRDLGGWCRAAVADRIDAAIEANRRSHSPAVKALVEACKGLVPTLRSGDWGNQDETAREIEEALAAVEREIGGA